MIFNPSYVRHEPVIFGILYLTEDQFTSSLPFSYYPRISTPELT